MSFYGNYWPTRLITTHLISPNLKSLVAQHPQSGVLWALLMPNGERENLKHAAAYLAPATIYKLATAVDSLPVVTEEQVVYYDGHAFAW